ncbi:MAG: metallophosphoesterase, partial [Clostridia bacterium]|nr:metallophosphoesterase [Clostridia bacterium]
MSVKTEIDRIKANVSSTYSVLESAGAEMPAEQSSDNLPGTAGSITAVLYGRAQSLTEEQKAQARDNIGVGMVGEVTLPDYWESYLPDKIAAIKAHQDEGGKDCFSFVVMTDMHYHSNLGKRSPAIAKRILDKCDIRYVLALGDFQNRECFSTRDETDAEWGDIRTMLEPIAENVLMVKGNHDGSWGVSNGTYYAFNFTPAEIYNRVYGLTYKYQNAVTDESGTAYYVDDTARKVRFVMLNTTCNLYEENEDGSAKYNNMTHARFTQGQFDFLTENALATVPNDDWNIIVCGHHPLWEAELKDAAVMLGVLNAYKTKSVDGYEGTYAGTAGGGAAYTNLADPTSADWKDGYRIGSTGLSTNSGTTVTNLIQWDVGDVIRITGIPGFRSGETRISDTRNNT